MTGLLLFYIILICQLQIRDLRRENTNLWKRIRKIEVEVAGGEGRVNPATSDDSIRVRLVELTCGKRCVEMATTRDLLGAPHWMPWTRMQSWNTRETVVRTLLEHLCGLNSVPVVSVESPALGKHV